VFVHISVSLAKTHQLIVFSVKVTIDGQMFPHVIALKVFMILASLIVNLVTQYVKIVSIHLLIVLIVWGNLLKKIFFITLFYSLRNNRAQDPPLCTCLQGYYNDPSNSSNPDCLKC
jgi:hypothetical protein